MSTVVNTELIKRSVILKTAALIISMMIIPTLSAQTGYESFYDQSLSINSTGMYVLGSWSIANIAIGSYGWASWDGHMKYFGQMNLFWNLVNISIAGFALYSNSITDLSSLSEEELLTKHLNTERLFLINSALDVGYMGAGILLRHISSVSEKRSDLLKGYGNSVILQGGFLLVFDMAMYFIMHNHRTGGIERISLSLSPEAITAGLHLNF